MLREFTGKLQCLYPSQLPIMSLWASRCKYMLTQSLNQSPKTVYVSLAVMQCCCGKIVLLNTALASSSSLSLPPHNGYSTECWGVYLKKADKRKYTLLGFIKINVADWKTAGQYWETWGSLQVRWSTNRHKLDKTRSVNVKQAMVKTGK